MKKNILIIAFALLMANFAKAEKLAPYYYCGTVDGTLSSVSSTVKSAIKARGFQIIGSYAPEGKTSDFLILTYTRKDLYNYVLKVENRGGLASVLKIGLRKVNSKIEISMINPDYIFNAYLQDDVEKYYDKLKAISNEVKVALKKVGGELKPFGGYIDTKDLRSYRYMIGMQDFNDPVLLKKYSSFEKGVEVIKANLEKGLGNTAKVYSIVFPSSKVAVFGVALTSTESGEAHFLPIIGEKHICAMPYEIILQDTEATMLHGRYRIALHWPELTMKTFTKIMSTPGAIEDALQQVTGE